MTEPRERDADDRPSDGVALDEYIQKDAAGNVTIGAPTATAIIEIPHTDEEDDG